METQSGVSRRVDQLEERARERHVRTLAERLGAEVRCDRDVLLARAGQIAELIEVHGHDRTVELVAAGIGLTPEQLEIRAARFVEA